MLSVMVPLAVVVVVVVKGVAAYFEGTLMTRFGERVIADTQIRLYAHFIRADLAWLHEMHSGKLIASFLYDAALLREAVTKALTGMVKRIDARVQGLSAADRAALELALAGAKGG